MRGRPDLVVRMSSRVHPGGTLQVAVNLTSASRTPVNFIHVDLGCEAETPGSEGAIVTQRSLRRALVAGAMELDEKTYAYTAAFPLPPDATPSYLGSTVAIRYRVTVHVSIPWWPDVRETYEVIVGPRLVPRPPPVPVVSTSLRKNEPFVEVSLDDSAFAPGDIIGGSIAFGNVERDRVRDVDLSLVGLEEDRVTVGPVREGPRFTAARALEGAGDGREIPLRFQIPREAAVSFLDGCMALRWAFEVRLGLKGDREVVHRVPITLAAFDQPPAPGPMRRRVGAGRWHSVWATVGRQHGLALGEGELELTGAIAGAEVTVRTAVREGRGELTADLRWEPWGLGLSIGTRRILDAGIDVDHPAFARRFRVRGREEAQVRATLGEPLRAALLAFDEVYLDDEHATVRASSPGHDQPWIGAFVGKVAALAVALQGASAQIPPPAAMTAIVPAWRAFAAEHGGRLRAGPMDLVDLVIEGARFEAETLFDRRGAAEHSRVRLVLDPPLSAPFDPSPEALAALPPAARALVASLRPWALKVTPGAITVELAPLADPGAARATMDEMLALAAALRGDRRAGPYR